MSDLVEFLRARLDEDWKLAFEAGDGGYDSWVFNPKLTWESGAGPRESVVRFSGSAMAYVAVVDPVHGMYGTWNAQHIARHDPERVLREVEAKRRVLALHVLAEQDDGDGFVTLRCMVCDPEGSEPFYPCPTVRLLAAVYADHPDYREEWRP